VTKQVKDSLRELSEAISAHKQALDNAVSEIEYLEKQNSQLSSQIQFAFTFPDGEYLTLEELANDYYRLKKRVGEY
jgi:chromosome segregation ATPase